MQLRKALRLAVTFLAITCAGQFPVLGLLVAYGAGTPGTAEISLIDASATLTQTGDTAWTLEKTGGLTGSTVTWNITANSTPATSGQLRIQGQMTVFNFGTGPATIGNIVVNLQKRVGNKWVTASSDIADATDGDDATSANIHRVASSEGQSTFSENAASGSLNFMDATNNTLFSLVPQVTIGAGQSRALLFQASFDNNVLNLATGALVRAEVIVSFGNATVNGRSTANVDINGNGSIDADEARVRSVPSRLTLTVPAPVNGNGTVTLTDTADDVATTGTLTITNLTFNLGATSGTVVAHLDAGTDGGTITNCAHLTSPAQTVNSGGFTFTSVQGLDLQACSTVDVGAAPPMCTVPGEPGCGWNNGDAFSRSQLAWDSTTSWYAAYDTVYASAFGLVEVGLPGTVGFSLRFTAPDNVSNFFVQAGTPAALNADLLDTTTSSAGQFGGAVLALRMNVDFSAVGLLGTTALGSLHLCAMTDASLNDLTINGLLALANVLLGGGSNSYTITAINDVVGLVNTSFVDGVPSSFAQDHLVNGGCP